MLKKQFWKHLISACAIFLLVVACSNSPSTTSNNIPIGVAFAKTGNAALVGQEQIIAATMAEQYFNEQGGINKTPIKVILQDTGSDEQGAINAFNTLINQNKVVGIVGPSLSQQAFSSDPIANRAQVPVVAASNTAKGIPEIGEYISRVSAPISIVAPNAIKSALKLNRQIQKVAVFFAQNDAYSKSETDIFQATVKDLKLDIVTVQKFLTTDTDFQTQASTALNLKPDLIVISALTSDGGNLVRQLRELGYKGLMIGGNGMNTSNLFPVCKKECDGLIIAQAYSPALDNSINKAFREAYKKQNKKEPPQFSAQAFTAIQVFVESLRELDKKTPLKNLPLEKLRVELNHQLRQNKYNTPLGEISFTPIGEVIQKEFYVAQIKMDATGENGQFTYLK